MAANILRTRIPLVDQDEQEKFESNLGRPARRGEIDESIAEFSVNLLDVTGVREAYSLDGKLEPDECHIFYGAEHFLIMTPFMVVRAQWEALHNSEEIQEQKPLDLGTAIDRLTTALDEDPELYETYKANIAMAFIDEVAKVYGPQLREGDSGNKLHSTANAAAKRFLDLFINSTKPPKP